MSIFDKKEKEKNRKRDKILKVAMKLFCRKEFEEVSIRKIAKEIDYSPATIYLYFRNKDEIFYELHKRGFEKLFEVFKTVEEKDPRVRLEKYAEKYIHFAIDNPEYYQLMFIKNTPALPEERNNPDDPSDSCYVLLKSAVLECRKENYYEIENVDAAALSIWSIMHGLASLILYRKNFFQISRVDVKLLSTMSMKFFDQNLFFKKS